MFYNQQKNLFLAAFGGFELWFCFKKVLISPWTCLPRNTEHTGDVLQVHSRDTHIIQSLRYR